MQGCCGCHLFWFKTETFFNFKKKKTLTAGFDSSGRVGPSFPPWRCMYSWWSKLNRAPETPQRFGSAPWQEHHAVYFLVATSVSTHHIPGGALFHLASYFRALNPLSKCPRWSQRAAVCRGIWADQQPMNLESHTRVPDFQFQRSAGCLTCLNRSRLNDGMAQWGRRLG